MHVIAKFLPTLSVRNGVKAIEFYKKAFQADEIMRHVSENGDAVGELAIGECHFIVSDEAVEYGNLSPETLGGTTIRMGLHVTDPDELFARVISAGATEIYPVQTRTMGIAWVGLSIRLGITGKFLNHCDFWVYENSLSDCRALLLDFARAEHCCTRTARHHSNASELP